MKCIMHFLLGKNKAGTLNNRKRQPLSPNQEQLRLPVPPQKANLHL